MESRNPLDRPLPSLRKHVVAAFLLLAAVSLFIVTTAVSEVAPEVGGTVALPPRPEIPASDTLLAETDEAALPDLLEGIIEDGANPTEGLVVPDVTEPSGPKAITVAPRKPDPLPKAPITALQTRSTHGYIPAVDEDGRTVFKAYARPYSKGRKPTLSVVVGGLGINPAMTRRAIEELPPEVTLAFAAHAPNLQADIDRAREYGHEVILELPMEGQYTDPSEPGADRLLRTDDAANMLSNLDYLLSRASGYFAVAPYNGDILLARSDAAGPVLSQIESAGLGFIADPQLSIATLKTTANAIKLPYSQGSMLIDETPEQELIERDLEKLRAQALSGGAPIGFGFAYPQTIDALITFVSTLDRVELAPASAAFPK